MLPTYLIAPEAYDILSTILIGIIVVYARELRADKDGVTFMDIVTWTLEGITFGLFGGEIASFTGGESYTWVYTIVFAWLGAPAMDKLTQTWFDKISNREKDATVITMEEVTLQETKKIETSKNDVPQ